MVTLCLEITTEGLTGQLLLELNNPDYGIEMAATFKVTAT
jgi:hypothetical protein